MAYIATAYIELIDETGDRFWYGLVEQVFRNEFTWEQLETLTTSMVAARLLGDQYESLREWLGENASTARVELWGVWQT